MQARVAALQGDGVSHLEYRRPYPTPRPKRGFQRRTADIFQTTIRRVDRACSSKNDADVGIGELHANQAGCRSLQPHHFRVGRGHLELLGRVRSADAHRARVSEPHDFAQRARRYRHRAGVRTGDVKAAVQPGPVDLVCIIEDRARRKHCPGQTQGRQDAHVPRVAGRRGRGAGAGQGGRDALARTFELALAHQHVLAVMEKSQDSFAGLDLDDVEGHAAQGVAAHFERRGNTQAICRSLAAVCVV
ncbi:hypothetical protein G6F57_016810 [Rhizopus arrhizus]|nr:hypothetical protein G6F57_016810 [Rhizopus arrhizus]